MNRDTHRDQRILDLLADRATGDLASEGLTELDRLLAAGSPPSSTIADPLANDSFEQAAARIELAFIEAEETETATGGMPTALKERLRSMAGDSDVVGSPRTTASSSSSTIASFPSERDRATKERIATAPAGPWPWLVAAAALVLAVVAWWPQASEVGPTPTAQALTTPTAARSDLLASAGDVLTLPWQATEDPNSSGAEGDVVWSADRQDGYMRIRGLKANNPEVDQYQLWVFDKTRDERHPVDGGVFDIPAGADEVIIPIDVRVPVGDAFLFAVTVEPPGGVVVSERERIVLVAQPAAPAEA